MPIGIIFKNPPLQAPLGDGRGPRDGQRAVGPARRRPLQAGAAEDLLHLGHDIDRAGPHHQVLQEDHLHGGQAALVRQGWPAGAFFVVRTVLMFNARVLLLLITIYFYIYIDTAILLLYSVRTKMYVCSRKRRISILSCKLKNFKVSIMGFNSSIYHRCTMLCRL